MDALFAYFFTIGSGIATGVVSVVLPSIWIYNFIKNRKSKKVDKAY